MDNGKISQGKIEALKKEFPFLEDYITDSIWDIKVSRVNCSLMKQTNEIEDVGVFETYFAEKKPTYLLDGNDKLICQVGRLPIKPKTFKILWLTFTISAGSRIFEESIKDCVARLDQDKADSIRFILETTKAFPEFDDDEGVYEAVIYKVPKGCTLAECLENEVENEQASIKKELALIDAR